MKVWYVPSWNGDLRLEADGDATELSIVKPTAAELNVVDAMRKMFTVKGWTADQDWIKAPIWGRRKIVVNAPIEKVGPLASKLMRPGEAVLTAITFKDGRVVTHSGADTEGLEETAKEAAGAGAEKAATVKRPTPCCPQCLPDACGPANEVLQAFMSPEQHASWAADRTLLVEGGLSGTRYLLAHRNSPTGVAIGRVCYDADAERVVHFHDRTVPPEEEVLAAMLILEHREPWLRNEATLFGMGDAGCAPVFKNPFGGREDGIIDASFTQDVGRRAFAAAMRR